ncbi:MAG: radical SAM protein [Desulfosarcina sp.]|nr:radical SAM protein [Desulfobacterales bacterium]
MFQHVLCLYPYRKDLKKFLFVPPIGIEIVGKIIEPYTEALDIIDLRTAPGGALNYIRSNTEMVCISVNWNRHPEFICRQIASVPSTIFTVIGGRHATEDPEGWLSRCPNVNAVARGDGEEIMEDLCQGRPLENIAGLSFRANGHIVHNPVRRCGVVRDNYYPNRRYRRRSYEIDIKDIATGVEFDAVCGSRGCPYNCAFCSFSRNPWGEKRNWSGRSPESVVDELEQIKAPFVGFTDDIFTHDTKRVARICDLILERNIRKKYVINARLEIARRPDLLHKMERAGFALLLLGVESAHDKTLQAMGKGFDTVKIRQYFEVLKDRPMILNGYFILGNIGESVEEMEQIVPFAHELGLDTIMLSSLRNNPFSGLADLVARNPGYHIAPDGKVYSNHCSLRALKRLRRRMYQQFYNKRQALRIFTKARRSGLLKLFLSQGAGKAANCVWALGQAWTSGHDKSSRTKVAIDP